MTFEIITIPCLQDNYAFLAHDHTEGVTLLVDVPESAPIIAVLAEKMGSYPRFTDTPSLGPR